MTNVHPQYQEPMAPMPYYRFPYVSATQYYQPLFQYQTPHGYQQPPPTQTPQNQQHTQNKKN